jgi:hypothetical protein
VKQAIEAVCPEAKGMVEVQVKGDDAATVTVQPTSAAAFRTLEEKIRNAPALAAFKHIDFQLNLVNQDIEQRVAELVK